MKNTIRLSIIILFFFPLIVQAQTTENLLPVIFVNNNVTTHIISPEPIQHIDISTDKIVGQIVDENILKIKPRNPNINESMVSPQITIIGETFISQFRIIYSNNPAFVDSKILIHNNNKKKINVGSIMMPTSQLKLIAKIVLEKEKDFNEREGKNGLVMKVNNIYVNDNYFFFDVSVENKSNIPYDINKFRFYLADKKITKATNVQQIEINPVVEYNVPINFKDHLHSVIVFEKFTFPDNKVLRIELTETQISGRKIILEIKYKDLLKAKSI